MNARAFAFETEFTPQGEVVGGAQRKFYSRDEADALAAAARSEAEARTRQQVEARGVASVDRIVGHLAPVAPQLAALADALRREAAELALIAARKIAGAALDARGAEVAADAVMNAVRLLRHGPSVVVSAAPDALGEIERRMEALTRDGRIKSVSFVSDAAARPGDWRVEWAEGSVGYTRADVEAAIDAAVNARLNDPVDTSSLSVA